jgi:hypothetical protein
MTRDREAFLGVWGGVGLCLIAALGLFGIGCGGGNEDCQTFQVNPINGCFVIPGTPGSTPGTPDPKCVTPAPAPSPPPGSEYLTPPQVCDLMSTSLACSETFSHGGQGTCVVCGCTHCGGQIPLPAAGGVQNCAKASTACGCTGPAFYDTSRDFCNVFDCPCGFDPSTCATPKLTPTSSPTPVPT